MLYDTIEEFNVPDSKAEYTVQRKEYTVLLQI